MLTKTMRTFSTFTLIGALATFSQLTQAADCQAQLASDSLEGKKMALTITKASSLFADGFANQGAFINHYKTEGQFDLSGLGGQYHDDSQGLYNYHKTGANTAVEQSVSFDKGAYITEYQFETENAGSWQQTYSGGVYQYQGRFRLTDAEETGPAPESTVGLSIALTITETESSLPGGYPTQGIVVQSYQEGNAYVAKGIGPETIDSFGTYTYTKVSADTAVEEAVQTSDFFTLPYTMVYTFETPTSGTWYQSFFNGLIIFKGTFTTFPSN